jgi:competence protein ComEC
MKLGERRSFYIFLCIILCSVFIFGFLFKKQQENFLVVSFLYVGQGDAIFIEAPNGVQVLIDAGPTSDVVRELSKVMPFWDRSIDMVIPTHADKDHIGGFPEVFKRFSVASVYDMESESTTGIFETYEYYKEEENLAKKEASSGDTIVLDSKRGVYLRVLFPEGNTEEIERNDTSTVVQLVYGDTEFMLSGDAGTMVEDYLVYKYQTFLFLFLLNFLIF